jgi:hypothetical protein
VLTACNIENYHLHYMHIFILSFIHSLIQYMEIAEIIEKIFGGELKQKYHVFFKLVGATSIGHHVRGQE